MHLIILIRIVCVILVIIIGVVCVMRVQKQFPRGIPISIFYRNLHREIDQGIYGVDNADND
jgi:hypothetical protein